MSIVSGVSRIRTHKVHNFIYYQSNNKNDSITRGIVSDLFSINDKLVGNIVINGYESYVDEKTIQQVTFSLFLKNESLNFICSFNAIKDNLTEKITFPNKLVTRDQNGKNLLIIFTQDEKDLFKISLAVQHI